jgi:hypothetical protein
MRRKLIRRMEDFLSCRLAEEHPQGRLRQHVERPSITISREAGTRGLEIGAKLVDYLGQFDDTAEHGWALFDQSLLARVIEERAIPDVVPDVASHSDPSRVPLPIVENLRSTPPAEWTMMEHSVNTIRRLCRLGNVVILGRGANFVTRDLPNAFHVRLVSPRAERTDEVAQSLGLTWEEAAEWLDSTDRARSAYVERHLGERVDDPTAYHVIINTGRLDEDRTARLIGDALLEWVCSRCLTAQA